MRLSWNEIRVRAAAFAKEWQDAAYEKGETHSFYNDFFDIFGVKRRIVARYEEHVKKLDPLAQAALDARASHPGATLAVLYDPDLMPPNLRKAHHALDRAADRLYRPGGFASERERVEHLFGLYEKITAPLVVKQKPKHRRRRASPRRLEHFRAMLSHGCVGKAVRPFLGLGMEAGSRTPTAWEASQTHRNSLKVL